MTEAEATRRVNYHYMADAMQRLEWNPLQRVLTEGRIPDAWRDIAAERAETVMQRLTNRIGRDVVKFFPKMGPGCCAASRRWITAPAAAP
ncbi:MAG: hypothetical protein ACK5LJ_10430 [Paracoccus sp. (in: a-proteobacteria)]